MFFYFKEREDVKKINYTNIGIDAIIATVESCDIKDIEGKIERRNHNGNLYLQVVKKNCPNTYNVVIILPSIIRANNLCGFSIDDITELKQVKKVIQRDLYEILKIHDLSQLVIKKIEINSNKKISSEANIKVIIDFLSRALLKTDTQQHEYCYGRRISENKTLKEKVITGFRTDRHSTGRFYIKVYDKTEQLISNTKKDSILRIELQYTKRGIASALEKKGKITLLDILNVKAIYRLIDVYVKDVQTYIRPPIRLYLNDATNLLVEDLKAGYKAYEAFIKRYAFVQYDFEILKVALRKYYRQSGKKETSASTQLSRIKKKILQNQIVLNVGTVKELQDMFRNIENQGLYII